MNVGQSDGVTIWTIQPREVWTQLKRDGELRHDRSKSGLEEEGLWQYDWLDGQLRRRLPSYDAGYPWFAYCSKPDLRQHRWSLSGDQVCIELRPAPQTCVRYPIWGWDTVYGGNYLARSLDEFASWTRDLAKSGVDEDTWPLPDPLRSRLEASWERLFDPSALGECWLTALHEDDPRLDGYWPIGCTRPDDWEAVLGVLLLDEVVDVRSFRGRG